MRIPSWIPGLVIGLAAAGCTAAPQPRLYVLSALTAPGAEPPQRALAAPSQPASGSPASPRRVSMVTIGVMPVTVAPYLDRPEIIVRRSSNELQVLEGDRWAEPIGANATRALFDNLSVLLAQRRISILPMRGSQRATYELSLDLTAFEVDETGAAVLAGDWTLIDPATGAARAGGRLNKSIAVGRDAGGDTIAAALSRNLIAVSEDIAREITALGPPGQPRRRDAGRPNSASTTAA